MIKCLGIGSFLDQSNKDLTAKRLNVSYLVCKFSYLDAIQSQEGKITGCFSARTVRTANNSAKVDYSRWWNVISVGCLWKVVLQHSRWVHQFRQLHTPYIDPILNLIYGFIMQKIETKCDELYNNTYVDTSLTYGKCDDIAQFHLKNATLQSSGIVRSCNTSYGDDGWIFSRCRVWRRDPFYAGIHSSSKSISLPRNTR